MGEGGGVVCQVEYNPADVTKAEDLAHICPCVCVCVLPGSFLRWVGGEGRGVGGEEVT